MLTTHTAPKKAVFFYFSFFSSLRGEAEAIQKASGKKLDCFVGVNASSQ